MKITFEGNTFNDVLDQMEDMLNSIDWSGMPAKNFLRRMSEKPVAKVKALRARALRMLSPKLSTRARFQKNLKFRQR